jgi:hypothetical protein
VTVYIDYIVLERDGVRSEYKAFWHEASPTMTSIILRLVRRWASIS